MRLVHYLNQFFAGLGAEEAARTSPVRLEGAVGPGRGLAIPVSYTLACGDDYFGEHEPEALDMLTDHLSRDRPDVLICGPAFGSGRYGYACARLAAAAVDMTIPAVTAMDPGNPGVAVAGPHAYVLPTSGSVTGMRDALSRLAVFADRLGRGEEIAPSELDRYVNPRRRGRFVDRTAADRAVDLLLAKLAGEPTSELTLRRDRVVPAPPLARPESATLALATEAACVPLGNPDRLPRHHASTWHRYRIAHLDSLRGFETVHGGFDGAAANEDPNRLVPLDALRTLQSAGRIGSVYGELLTTTGNSTPLDSARQMGAAMAREMKEAGVAAIVLTGT